MSESRTRLVAAVALLALVPVVAYGLSLGFQFAMALTAVSVVIIAGSVALMFSPAEGGHGDHGGLAQ